MKNIGKKCYIKVKTSICYGEWGIIKHFDGECYHVAIANGKTSFPIFDRDQIKIPRKQNEKNIL
jgi:hypothetical protein